MRIPSWPDGRLGTPILRARGVCSVHRADGIRPVSPTSRRPATTACDVRHRDPMPIAAAVLLLAGGPLAPSARPAGQWPVRPPTVVRPFDPPAANWNAGHRGIDLAAVAGQAVVSMAPGVVSFVGTIAGVPVVSVAYPGSERLRSTYEPVDASVRVGQQVGVGATLGTVAPSGGHCGGVHGCLHVGLRTDNRYLDPATLVDRRPAVLKPQS